MFRASLKENMQECGSLLETNAIIQKKRLKSGVRNNSPSGELRKLLLLISKNGKYVDRTQGHMLFYNKNVKN